MASSWDSSARFRVRPWRMALVWDSSGRVPIEAGVGVGFVSRGVRRVVVMRRVVWRRVRRVWRLVGEEEEDGRLLSSESSRLLSSLLSFDMDWRMRRLVLHDDVDDVDDDEDDNNELEQW